MNFAFEKERMVMATVAGTTRRIMGANHKFGKVSWQLFPFVCKLFHCATKRIPMIKKNINSCFYIIKKNSENSLN